MLRAAGQPPVDCVDCFACVTACPAGIDIRDGLQMDCIQCGQCVDACDTVMGKPRATRRPDRYDTEANRRSCAAGKGRVSHVVRPRTVLYAALDAGIGGFMHYSLATRSFMGLSVLHDRNPLFVTLSDGSVRNGYTVRLSNKQPGERHYALAVEGLPGRGSRSWAECPGDLPVPSDATQEFRVLVFAAGRRRLGGIRPPDLPHRRRPRPAKRSARRTPSRPMTMPTVAAPSRPPRSPVN